MRYIGIDVGKDKHSIAVIGSEREELLKPAAFSNDYEGYAKLDRWLGEPEDAIVGLEATGHYWKNLVARLVTRGFAVVLLNPLRTRRFAEADLVRAKTDSIDARTIARFLSEKRPEPTVLPSATSEELREEVRLRDRYMQDLGDRKRQLHRALDLVFPEFPSIVRELGSSKATTLLRRYPTSKDFAEASEGELANMTYGGRYAVGRELAKKLIATAKRSIAAHHAGPYRMQVIDFSEDIETLQKRLSRCESRIDKLVDRDDVAKLLTTIDGIGPITAARLVATFGDFSHFDSHKALASFVGVAPIVKHSGKRTPHRAGTGTLGAAKLRHKLYMPTLRATRSNPSIQAFYERLLKAGKPKKLAIIACMRKLLAQVFAVAKRRSEFVSMLPLPT